MSKRASAPASYTPTRDMRRILVRVPADLADWIDDAAESVGLSRDLFVRELLIGIRIGFASMGKKGSVEARMLADMRKKMGEAMEDALDETVGRVVKLSASGVRQQPRPRRRSS